MSKSRHTEGRMIGALKQLEAGRKVEDVGESVLSHANPNRAAAIVLSGGRQRKIGLTPFTGAYVLLLIDQSDDWQCPKRVPLPRRTHFPHLPAPPPEGAADVPFNSSAQAVRPLRVTRGT